MLGSYYPISGFGAVQSVLNSRGHYAPAAAGSQAESYARAMGTSIQRRRDAAAKAAQLAARGGKPASAGRLAKAASGYGAFGAAALGFDPVAVWNDWVAGSAPTNDNAAGKRSAQALQAALNQLGYGPLTVDGQFGPKSGAAFTAFATANGATTNGPNPTQDGIQKISDLLNSNAKPGPSPAITYTKENGVYVEQSGGAAKSASMSTGMLVAGAAALAIILGGLVLASKKKGAPHGAEKPTVLIANRRRYAPNARAVNTALVTYKMPGAANPVATFVKRKAARSFKTQLLQAGASYVRIGKKNY